MVRKNSMIAPLVGVVLALAIGIFLISLINSDNSDAVPVEPVTKLKEAPTVQILVATTDIQIGKKIEFVDLSWRSWPESLLNPQYITQNEKPDFINKLIGGIAKLPLLAGEPIMEGKIVQPGDRGAMALLLRKGMRAVSVPINVTTSAGGFILPGDYVDVIFTTSVIQQNLFESETDNNNQRKAILKNYLALKLLSQNDTDDKDDNQIKNPNDTIPISKNLIDKNNIVKVKPKIRNNILDIEKSENSLLERISNEEELLITNGSQVSELMLENVKILAIDQNVTQNPVGTPPNAQKQATAIVGATATLEVTPEQAKLLAWSASSGTLTLSLRSFSENLSKQDSLALNQKLPKTKTTFAFPIKKIFGDTMMSENANANANPTPEPEPIPVEPVAPETSNSRLDLIRNGNISFLRNSQKQNNYQNNTRGPNVLR